MTIQKDLHDARVLVAAKKLLRFTFSSVSVETGIDPIRVRQSVKRLEGRGDVIVLSRAPKLVYILNDLERVFGADAEALSTWEGRLWNAMRTLVDFSVLDLRCTQLQPPSPQRIQNYCTDLAQIGVIKVLRQKTAIQEARYRVAKDLGQLPPVKKKVPLYYDPNSGSYLNAETLAS